jgi:hypothetical protein
LKLFQYFLNYILHKNNKLAQIGKGEKKKKKKKHKQKFVGRVWMAKQANEGPSRF